MKQRPDEQFGVNHSRRSLFSFENYLSLCSGLFLPLMRDIFHDRFSGVR
jgi:hypothetical protein